MGLKVQGLLVEGAGDRVCAYDAMISAAVA
jgi:hypothetical protein